MQEEFSAWRYLKAFINQGLGTNRIEQYHALVENMLRSFDNLSVEMSLKVHFLHQHRDLLDMLISSDSDQYVERFHQVTAQLYSGKRLNILLANLCWNSLMQEADEEEGQAEKQTFL